MCKYNLCPKCRKNEKCETSKGCFECMCKKSNSHLANGISRNRYKQKHKK